MFCTNCGAQNPEDGLFCVNCGQALRPTQEQHIAKRKRLPKSAVIAIFSGIVLLVGLVVAYFVIGAVVFNPQKPVDTYLASLQAGHYGEATQQVEPNISTAKRALLVDKAAGQEHLSQPQVSSISKNADGSYSAAVSYSLDGQVYNTSLPVKATGHQYLVWQKWEVSKPLLNSVELSVPSSVQKVTINGITVDLKKAANNSKSVNGPNGFEDEAYTQYALAAYPGKFTAQVQREKKVSFWTGDDDVYLSSSHLTSEKEDTAASEESTSFDEEALNTVIQQYSSTDAAAAVMVLDESTAKIYETKQAAQRFTAAGLYLPVYLKAQEANNSVALTDATAMMQSMSNESGNAAIADLGGIYSINGYLMNHNYGQSDYQRNFADQKASAAGYENYSSAHDSVQMLSQLDELGQSGLLRFDVAGEGIGVPSGMAVSAHRGQGMNNAYNVFAIVTVDGKKAAVSVMTQNLGNDTAKAVVSAVLANVDSQLKK